MAIVGSLLSRTGRLSMSRFGFCRHSARPVNGFNLRSSARLIICFEKGSCSILASIVVSSPNLIDYFLRGLQLALGMSDIVAEARFADFSFRHHPGDNGGGKPDAHTHGQHAGGKIPFDQHPAGQTNPFSIRDAFENVQHDAKIFFIFPVL